MGRKTPPYWLDDGSETCWDCTLTYHYHVELRCTGCDRGMCTHCAAVVRPTVEVLCRECAEERED